MAYLVEYPLVERYAPGIAFSSLDTVYGKYNIAGSLDPFSMDPADVPTEAFLLSSHKSIPDFVKVSAIWALCPEIQAVFEAAEPNTHQWFPVHIRRKSGKKPIARTDGSVLAVPYFLLNIQIYIDALDLSRSQINSRSGNFISIRCMEPVTLIKSVIQDHHIWTGRRQARHELFISDELYSRFKDRKPKGAHFIYCPES